LSTVRSPLTLHDALPIYRQSHVEHQGFIASCQVCPVERAAITAVCGDKTQSRRLLSFGQGKTALCSATGCCSDARHQRDTDPCLDRKSTRLNSSHVKISY